MMGRPSPRKDQHTRKAEQVSWLAAWLTLCAFPSLSGQSGNQALRRSGNQEERRPFCRIARLPECRSALEAEQWLVQISTPLTVAGQQWLLPHLPPNITGPGITIFPRRSPDRGPLSLAYSVVRNIPPRAQRLLDHVRCDSGAISIRTALESQALSPV